METLITVFHVVICLFLIVLVLSQHGKGADAGANFGSSQAMIGTKGAPTFLLKVTVSSAILFMITSLILAYMSAQSASKTVFDPKDQSLKMPTTQSSPSASQSDANEASKSAVKTPQDQVAPKE